MATSEIIMRGLLGSKEVVENGMAWREDGRGEE
jgi:hypothetical protein